MGESFTRGGDDESTSEDQGTGPDADTPTKRPPMTISAEDLRNTHIDNRVNEMRSAVAPQLVREVGVAGSSGLGVFGVILAMALAGLIGGLIGSTMAELTSQSWQSEAAVRRVMEGDVNWSCVENLDDSDADQILRCAGFDPWYGHSRNASNIVWLGTFGILLGCVIAGWDAISARSIEKFLKLAVTSILFLVPATVVGAWLAQAAYDKLTEGIDQYSSSVEFQIHISRGAAWAVFGVFLGGAIGASSLSSRRALQGAAGGLIGAFVGGFVFDFIDTDSGNGVANRLIGMVITGVAIAVAMSLIEIASRQHWLEIVSGGMAGKQFILHRDRTVVGSSPTCDITLIKDPSMAPRHLQLDRVGPRLNARSFDGSGVVVVNGAPISTKELEDGDMIQLGSTALRYRSRSEKMPTGAPMPTYAVTTQGGAPGQYPQGGAYPQPGQYPQPTVQQPPVQQPPAQQPTVQYPAPGTTAGQQPPGYPQQ